MKLHYWRPAPRHGSTMTNFGDELNAVLWPRLLGGSFFDDDDSVAFFGIGSMLGWPKQGDDSRRHRIVFGTGAARSDAAQREPCDDHWRIYCVRGPLTAGAYGLDASLAITDPAILVARFYEPDAPTTSFGYMPHVDVAEAWSPLLKRVCSDLGMRFIDPRDDVQSVIAAIGSVTVLITEAMHGAIVADALRVPWVPVFTTGRPHRFKWTDWCTSMELAFEPHRVGNVAHWAARGGLHGPTVERAAGGVLSLWLRAIRTRCRPCLSDAAVHTDRLDRLDAALAQLQSDAAAGCFSRAGAA